MPYFDPRKYYPTLQEWMRYSGDIAWDECTVLKNHGNYVEIMFPSSAPKGHDSYDLYLDVDGRLIKVCGHAGNVGFSDTKYF